ncbi:GntR family transcriptional regulator [Paracoccus spongiarum]|uniref:GntR family transcriptional regulator n=1 Tax=Paracoccus spongiarum TaxID=3064387 RepID=A0ABT9JAI3_9RHOB|nr:GntR family transcriptional regulator [Paracoccus sp. 2205BS29-5]MDP5306818.1 GntR family transcriptional regulator [Paracoccus sp. 2205BS29-5]
MLTHPAGHDLFEDLRARILSLEMPPGMALSRADLSARYGISSTPLRDALLRLQDEGLVDIQPQSRTLVSLIDLDQARQIHVLRSAVEAEVAMRLAQDPPAGLGEELQHLIAAQQDEAQSGNMKGFARLDLAFHEALFRHARLQAVHQVIRRESVHIDRLRALHLMQQEKARQILTDHRAIAAAIADRLPDAAGAQMRRHLSQSILLGPQLTSEMPAYFTKRSAGPEGSAP